MTGPAHEWPTRRRYALAGVTGLAWALLWFGLDRIAAPPIVFWIASALLCSPVLAFLARDALDLALLVLAAFVASLVVSLVAASPPAAGIPRLVLLAAFAWIGAALGILLLFALRVRGGGLRAA